MLVWDLYKLVPVIELILLYIFLHVLAYCVIAVKCSALDGKLIAMMAFVHSNCTPGYEFTFHLGCDGNVHLKREEYFSLLADLST